MFEDVFIAIMGIAGVLFGVVGSVGFARMIRDDARWALRFGGAGHRAMTVVCDIIMLAITVVAFLLGAALLMQVLT